MADATLRKLVTDKAVKDIAIIDDLVNASGILQTALVMPSSHGKFHKYKKVSALPTASFREIGGTYTDQTVNDEIHQLDLKMIGLVQSEDKAICDEIGVQKYFTQNRPAVMEAIGQKIAKGIIYGTNATYGDTQAFRGWHEMADAAGSTYYTDVGGGDASTTSIFIVKYKMGVNGIVYNSATVNGGNFITTTVLNDGKPVLEYIGSGTKKPVYQVLYETDLAYLNASIHSIHALVGVNASNCPTDPEMKAAIDSVKGTAFDTFIYTSRLGKRAIETLNTTEIITTPDTQDFNTVISRYAGIPIIVDENIGEADTLSSLPYGLS